MLLLLLLLFALKITRRNVTFPMRSMNLKNSILKSSNVFRLWSLVGEATTYPFEIDPLSGSIG